MIYILILLNKYTKLGHLVEVKEEYYYYLTSLEEYLLAVYAMSDNINKERPQHSNKEIVLTNSIIVYSTALVAQQLAEVAIYYPTL